MYRIKNSLILAAVFTSPLRVFFIAGVVIAGALGSARLDFSAAAEDQVASPNADTAFVQQAKLEANDRAPQDANGFAVAISGDTAIVGAPRNGTSPNQSRGAAYIYLRTGTTWAQQQKLTPSDGASNDQFGYSVAINGNTAAVGRYNTTTGQNRGDGKVYIFTRTGTTWTETQTLQSSDIAQGDLFGNSLAFEGDTLVVGALNKTDGSIFFKGAAYVFTRPMGGGMFAQEAKLTASDGVFADFFGYSVAISGDSVLVGATSQIGQPDARGKAVVFTRSGTTWTQQQVLRAGDGSNGDAFGISVGISGDTAVIGARADTINGVADQGSAYVFNRTGSTWTQSQQVLGVETTQRNDAFGSGVAINGNTIVIGSPAHESEAANPNHGAVYIFSRATTGGQFARTDKLVHIDTAPDALGTSVAFDGSSIISGAPSKSSARGASYIFNSVPTNGQSRLVGGDMFNSISYGSTHVSVSDDTALVGSLNFGTLLYQKIGGAWQFVRKLSATVTGGDTAPLSSGNALLGDVMVVGSSTSRVNNVNGAGAAYVFNQVNGTWIQGQRLLPPDSNPTREFGGDIAMTANTIVIADDETTESGNNRQGSVYVYVLTGTNWTFQQKLVPADGAANDNFGQSVAISGDTIVVGSPNDDTDGVENKGSVYVFTRSGSTWTERTRLTNTDGEFGSGFGSTVAIDGSSIVVGAPRVSNGQGFTRGAVYVFVGSGASFGQSQRLVSGEPDSFGFGKSVAISGDNLVVGSPESDDATANISNGGAAFLYRRNGTTFELRERLMAFDRQQFDNLGTAVGISGETVIAGAPFADVSGINQLGAAYIFPPSAAPAPVPVTISGRVLTPDGRGLRNAIVYLSGPLGKRTVTTSSFGNYSFDNVMTGSAYTLGVASKRFKFAPQPISQLTGALSDFNLQGSE